MERFFKGFVRDIKQPPSQGNVDSDTHLNLRRYTNLGYPYQFGEVGIDGGFHLVVDVPTPVDSAPREVQEEWVRGRELCLSRCVTDPSVLLSGLVNGYITEGDFMFATEIPDRRYMEKRESLNNPAQKEFSLSS